MKSKVDRGEKGQIRWPGQSNGATEFTGPTKPGSFVSSLQETGKVYHFKESPLTSRLPGESGSHV